jgi:ABC-2 type transport system ATP-binding protein
MDAAIDIRELSKHFSGRAAVDRLTLQVPAGAVLALLGDNGAGKTTTIRMLVGQLPPDSGQAFILGHDCWRQADALRQSIGYVPERPKLYDWMTVDETGWFVSGFRAAGFLERYRERVTAFALEPSAKLKRLSKGEYAKVSLALALASEPQVLILDEPTSGLDLAVRREFLSSMVGLAAEGRTVLISSHQVAEVERIASHVAFLARGRLVLACGMDELRRRLVRLTLRHAGTPPDPAQLGTVLERNGLGRQWTATLLDPDPSAVEALSRAEGVSEFESSPVSLEEAYCALLTGKEPRP